MSIFPQFFFLLVSCQLAFSSPPFFSLFLPTEIHKNVISPLEGDTKEPELHKKHTDLKQKMRDLNHGFERLRKLSHEGFTEDSGERKEKPTRTLCIHQLHYKYL